MRTMKTLCDLTRPSPSRRSGAPVGTSRRRPVIAVVDAHGETLGLLRMRGAALSSVAVATNKAFTSARLRRPSAEVGRRSRNPRPASTSATYGDPRYLGWGGGLPCGRGREVVGAVAVSGSRTRRTRRCRRSASRPSWTARRPGPDERARQVPAGRGDGLPGHAFPLAAAAQCLVRPVWLAGVYVPLAIKPEGLRAALAALPALGFAGCNVTIPHKETAMAAMDSIDPWRGRIGALNCVVVRPDGSLHGTNNDA